MSALPTWDDSGQGDLLALVALGSPATPAADQEWATFVAALRAAATADAGLIRPNRLRPLVRGHVAPRRIGAFTNAALAADLIAYTGEWQISDDAEGRNRGKPARVMCWIGGDL